MTELAAVSDSHFLAAHTRLHKQATWGYGEAAAHRAFEEQAALRGLGLKCGTRVLPVEQRQMAKAILAKEEALRYTLGPWYVPGYEDAHGEWTDAAELQQALWSYVKSGDRRIRLQHDKDVVAGQWVEAMAWPFKVNVPMTTPDGEYWEYTFPENTVFLGVQWEPWAWSRVLAGEIRGYSIGGEARRIMVDMDPADRIGITG